MEGGAFVRAIVINEPGGPERLTLTEVPEPSPDDDEVLIDVTAAGVNYIDTYHRTGLYPMDYPLIPGVDGAGRVAAVGGRVEGIEPGERVAWPWGALGSYAEKLAVPARWVVPIPDPVDDGVAVASMVQGLTAHYLSTDTFPLSEGDRCLIHAGAGGVGFLLTQVAKIRGAEVITTVGSEEKASLSRSAGSDKVIIYTEEDFRGAIESDFGEHPLDVVYDGVGAATFEPSLELLKPRGMMVTYGNASGPVPEISPLILSQKGSLFLTRPTLAHYLQTREELLQRAADVFGWIEDGRLQVLVGAEFPLTDAADAHHALEGRQTTGKVLLRP